MTPSCPGRGARARLSGAIGIWLGGLSALILVSSTACTEPPSRLVVDVRTELVRDVEFDSVRTEMLSGSAAGSVVSHPTLRTESYASGARVAEFDALLRGPVTLRVSLMRGTTLVLQRPVSVVLTGPSHAVTLLLPRDCLGVECPLAGGDPVSSACVGGSCQDERCSEETSEFCEAECAVASECDRGSPCAVAECSESGTCFFTPDDARCGPGETCHVLDGCQPGLCAGDGLPSVFEQALLNLPAGSWFEAPDSHLRPFCVPDSVGVRGISGCRSIVTSWSGGAYDRDRHRMVIWGGGASNYSGNELYAFDTREGTWSRITEPSTIPDGSTAADFFNRDPLPDGEPSSRATYDGVEYIDHLGLIMGHGGQRATDGHGTALTWFFDAENGWSRGADGPGGFPNASAYDPTSRQFLVMKSESMHFYDIDADSWSQAPGFRSPPLWPRYAVSASKTATVDPTRQLFWVVGGGQVMVWDIVASAPVTDAWVTTGGGDYTNGARVVDHMDQLFESGGGDVYDVIGPGIDYDSVTDAFVAWPNQGAPYVLDLTSREWTVGESAGAPVSAAQGGTLGRWRYIEAYNVFILINSVDENVYFYKHSPGCGPLRAPPDP